MSNVLEIVPMTDAMDYHIHRDARSDQAWDFSNGDPEIYQYSDRLIVPGQRVLDLGCGALRASALFALHGMEVVAVDGDREQLGVVDDFARTYNLPVRTLYEDMQTFCHTDISDPYHVVLMAQSTVHARSRYHAMELAYAGYDRVAPGGYFWFRAATTLDNHFETLQSHPDARKLEETTYEVDCRCSGVSRREPVTFLDPLDIHTLLAAQGATFVHSQVLPTKGHANIMYGQDFNPGIKVEQGGSVTVLAQKPL